MEKTFDILRINKLENTITVLLSVGTRTLQQDIKVDNFVDMEHINEQIQFHLSKFEEDLKKVVGDAEAKVHPELQALVDKYTQSFEGDK